MVWWEGSEVGAEGGVREGRREEGKEGREEGRKEGRRIESSRECQVRLAPICIAQ